MRNLSGFAIPGDGEVSLCEVDGRLHSMKFEYANISAFTNAVSLVIIILNLSLLYYMLSIIVN